MPCVARSGQTRLFSEDFRLASSEDRRSGSRTLGDAVMVATTLSPAQSRAGYFYFWMAAACALFAWGAFSATYWLQLAAGTFVGGTPVMHLHAALFFSWTLLFMWQTWQAANGRIERHRAFGVAGVSLATAMVIIGLTLALASVREFQAHGFGDRAKSFFVLPFTGITLFAIFFVAAVANISRPEWHKRFMLVATVSLLQAAAGRVGFLINSGGGGPGLRPGTVAPPPQFAGFQGAVMVSLFLVAGAIYDWRTRGRPHPVYLIG